MSLPACRDKVEPETPRQALERLAPSRAETPLAPAATPGAYKIAFDRIDASSKRNGNGELLPRRLTRTVHRPFSAEVGGELKRRLGFEQASPSSVERAVLLRPLADEPRPDVYPPAAYHDADRTRRVAGRTCRVVLFAHDEYCVDAAGIVLASRQGTTVDVATRVTPLGGAMTAAEIAAELAEGVSDKLRGSVRPLEPTSSPPSRDDWSLATPPDGFTFVGRYTSVPLSGEVIEQGSQGIVAGIVDVYVRGGDAILVDRGGKLDTNTVTEKNLGPLDDAVPVDLGQLGPGQEGIGGVGPFGYREVRAFPEKGRYVVVAGTVPVDQLVAVARALRPSPGTSLRYLDKL